MNYYSMGINDYLSGIKQGDRSILAKAITLIESSLEGDKKTASDLIEQCTSISKKSIRIGISGTPGVGKSTFIEALGILLTKKKYKIAVLAIDPSSIISQGSILGDKTRMEKLSNSEKAFIRPSPNKGVLGGVSNNTRDAIILCEAAGYDIIIVETVGVGQSETLVKSMTDVFIYLTLVENGDELQFMKKGIMELSDIVIINKSDQNPKKVKEMKVILEHYIKSHNTNNKKHIFTCSATNNINIKNVWKNIERFYLDKIKSGELDNIRNTQNIFWLKKVIEQEYMNLLYKNKKLEKKILEFEKKPIKNVRKIALDIIQQL